MDERVASTACSTPLRSPLRGKRTCARARIPQHATATWRGCTHARSTRPTSRATARPRSSTSSATDSTTTGRSSTPSAGSAATTHEGAVDGEIDFVLCHPERGRSSCLEVKGGGIECRHRGVVASGRRRQRERIEDPFQQALDHRYDLQRSSSTSMAGRKSSDRARASPSPTSRSISSRSRPTRRARDPLDRHDVEDIEAAIERVLAYHRGSRDERVGAGRERSRQMLRELLRAHGRARRPDGRGVPRARKQELIRSPTSRRGRCATSAAPAAWWSTAAPAPARRCSRSSTPSASPTTAATCSSSASTRRSAHHLHAHREARSASRSSTSTACACS